MNDKVKMGYTLPVFACASAIAALESIQGKDRESVVVDLIKPPQQINIPIEQVACLSSHSALAITRSDPGEHLDLTRNTPIWALVTREIASSIDPELEIRGGEGIGIQTENQNQAAIYSYARELITHNLQSLLSLLFFLKGVN
jgi:cobalt-precorrin-5B (C1)-methyltransferase